MTLDSMWQAYAKTLVGEDVAPTPELLNLARMCFYAGGGASYALIATAFRAGNQAGPAKMRELERELREHMNNLRAEALRADQQPS